MPPLISFERFKTAPARFDTLAGFPQSAGFMRFDLKLSQKVLILVSMPIVFMLVFVSTLSVLQNRAENAVWQERHSKDISNECNSLMTNILQAGLYLAVYKTSQQTGFLQRFDEAQEMISEQIKTLKLMLNDSPNSLAAVKRLDIASERAMTALNRARAGTSSRMGRFLTSREEITSSSQELISVLRDLVKSQKELISPEVQKEEQARFLISSWLLAGVILSVVIAVVAAVSFNATTTKRLLVMVQNTIRLGANKELLPSIAGTDEIATLDRSFHLMAKLLVEASQRKQELMQIVSHDLRTPLTSARSALSLLSSEVYGKLPDKAVPAVKSVETNLERLIVLINDLLDIEKLESGTFELVKTKVIVEELFERATEVVAGLAEQEKIKVSYEETDLIIEADADRLSQVLVNLLSNALKFSPSQSTITMSAAKIDAVKCVELRVTDQGRGIPKKYLKTIFDRFQQVTTDDAKRGKGTGLGLSICKAFVEAHGGTIGVDSEEGKGSSFWIRIPA